jgi:hypothetical protein
LVSNSGQCNKLCYGLRTCLNITLQIGCYYCCYTIIIISNFHHSYIIVIITMDYLITLITVSKRFNLINYWSIFVSQNFIKFINFIIVVQVMTAIFIYLIFIITITSVLIIKGSSAIINFEVSNKKTIVNFEIINVIND